MSGPGGVAASRRLRAHTRLLLAPRQAMHLCSTGAVQKGASSGSRAGLTVPPATAPGLGEDQITPDIASSCPPGQSSGSQAGLWPASSTAGLGPGRPSPGELGLGAHLAQSPQSHLLPFQGAPAIRPRCLGGTGFWRKYLHLSFPALMHLATQEACCGAADSTLLQRTQYPRVPDRGLSGAASPQHGGVECSGSLGKDGGMQ